MLGHNTAALTEQTTEVPTPGQKRIAREWLVKRTGDPGTVDLSFDIVGLTLTGTAAADFQLLIDADGDFSSGATEVSAASLTGTKVAFTALTIPDGSYLTIVTAPVPPVAPGGVIGANLWLKANAGATASGTDLTGWTDQTATNTFTVSGNPKTGASAINFNNVIDFDGVGDYLTGNANITFQTLYAVIKRNNTSFNSTVMGVSTSVATNIGYIMKGDKLATGNNNGAYFQSTGSLGIDKARLGVVEIVAGATATGNKTFIDGTSYSTEVLSLDGTFNTYSDIPHIGRSQRTTEQDYFNGQIAELIMYPASHSDIDRRKIQSYLALKYGITIPGDYLNSGGTTIWDATANAVYHNDLFGIGQDNGSGLIQSASNSINTGAGDGNPVVGNGNLYIGATSANLANGDFLIVGHNNGSLSEQTSDVPTGIYNRIGREWKVDHTGDVGTLTITFDKDGLTLAANRHFSLLIDADGDGDFTTGTVNRVASSFIIQDRVYFRNVSLPDNAVITVATLAEPIGSASLWLKADAGVTESSGDLTNWTDQAGHNSFSKTGTVSYSDNSINFNPAVVFQNTNSQTVDPANSLNGNTEITYVDGFAVYKYTSANTGTLMGSTDLGDNYGKAIFGSNADNKLYVGNGTNSKFQSFDYPNLQGNYLLGNFDVSPTDSPYATGRLNGANQTITTAGGGDFSSIHIKPMIGGTHSSGNAVDWLPFHGEVAEIVLFPTSLSGLDKQEVESYLAIKYGIHLAGNYLDGGGTTIWDATANSTYHNDVFGIGKEDGNGLNQTQSNSINTGSGNGTGQSGKGNIVLSSASNLGTGEFLMVGHNNEALTEQTSDVPVNLAGEERLTREWKVSVTGVPGSVDLSFNTSGLTLTGTSAGDFKLLVDLDGNGDFTDGTVTVIDAASYSSNVATFTAVTLPNNAVITFITDIGNGPGVLGASLWLKANDGASNSGSNLTGWTDKTGTNTFTKTGTISFTNNALNFNPQVTIINTGAQTVLPVNRLEGTTPITYVDGFAVYRSNSNTSTLIGSTVTSANYGPGIFLADNDLEVGASNGINSSWAEFDNLALGNYFISNLDVSPSISPYISGRKNGLAQSMSWKGGVDYPSFDITPMIGGTNNMDGNNSSNGWFPFNGDVAEVILYPTSLSLADKVKVESYLALKYGITLDQSVLSYVSSTGAVLWNNVTFWNDVFGIGLDSGFGLSQLSSNSIKSGSGDGTGQSGKGNIVISNASALTDGDFLVIGNDGSSFTAEANDLPLSLITKQRIKREWKVKHTADVGTVNLTFDTLGLNIVGTTLADFQLLIDLDGDGNFTAGPITTVAATSFTNGVVGFSNVTLPDGAVFTFITGDLPIGPAGIVGPSLWLKANDGVAFSGTVLNNWTDQSGYNTFTKTGNISYTPNAVNFNPNVTFLNTFVVGDVDSVADSKRNLPTNRLDGNNPITYVDGFAVYKTNTDTSTLLGGILPGNSYGVGIFIADDDPEIGVGDGSSSNWGAYNFSPISSYRIANLDASPASSPYIAGRNNGLNQTISWKGGSGFNSIDFTPMIGGTNNNGNSGGWYPFNGDVAEVVLFPKGLSSAEKLKVESYLAIKYGITLDSSVINYVNSSGVSLWNNVNYWNDVFGIGKDDMGTLNQIISNSINTGNGDGTGQSGKGNIVLSNSSSLDDGDFLLIGHDTGALTEQTSDIPTSINYTKRLAREWKVDHTNNVGSLNLKFDISGLTVTGTSALNFELLVDQDGNGNFTDGTVSEVVATSLTGTVLEFQNVTLPNGAVFTFVTDHGPTVWDGTTWSLGIPTAARNAIVDGDLIISASLDSNNLTINTTKNVTVNPNVVLTVNGNLVNNGLLTFKSDAAGSGLFGKYTGATIAGTGTTVERYIPARRAFRFLTSSVTTSGTINANWQESGANNSGLGTHITGAGGATSGFDVTTTNNPSMFIYDTAQSWTAVANTNSNTLTAGFPYRLMVRGDRTVSLSTNTPTPTVTVLRSTGSLKTGDFSPPLATGIDQFSFIGNPYQAPIDIKAVLSASTNMNINAVYYWDPTLNTRGGYVTRDLVSDSNSPSSSFNQYLQPGQAVFVQKDNTATAPTLTITENHKSVINSAPGVFKLKNNTLTNTTSVLRFNLNSNAVSNTVLDGGLILFSSAYDSNVDSQDLVKLGNLDEQVSIKLQNKALAIAKQSIPNDQDEIPLEVLNYRNTNYTWNYELQNYSGPTPFLYDSLSQTYTEIVDSGSYAFTIDNQNALTFSPDRFKIKFTNKTLSTANFDLKTIVLYPNPLAKGGNQEFTINNAPSGAKVKLYSILGQELPIDVNENNGNFRVKSKSQLSKGIYFVKITQGQQASEFKLIVE